ncbi:zeta toxin family protein [Actinoallomurus sp. NPDC052274]|uniref:zeta toxin family protein n=1 Tax=Actinoallomurus sp. NPDC052274 TaxID=3155420 RepID=UPI00342D2442
MRLGVYASTGAVADGSKAMAADRTSDAEAAERVEEPAAPERQTPPDRPGSADAPSRAQSRAGAAAANDTAPPQLDARAADAGTSEGTQDADAGPNTGASADDPASSTEAEAEESSSQDGEPAVEPTGRAAIEQPTEDPLGVDTTEASGSRAPDSPLETESPGTDAPVNAEPPEADGGAASPEPRVDATVEDEQADSDAIDELAVDGDTETLAVDDDESPFQPDDDEGIFEKVDDLPAPREPRDQTTAKPATDGSSSADGSAVTEAVKKMSDVSSAAASVEASRRATDAGVRRRVEPLDDRAYAEHVRHVQSSVDEAVERGESTDDRYTLNPEHTTWNLDRAKVHREIVDDLYSTAADVPNDGQAIIAGGLGGAGKSATLENHAGIDRSKYFTINPDDIKESLGRRNLIPPIEGLAPMERARLVHEESSQLAKALAGRAYADRKNVIWDITMSSKGSTVKRIQQLRDAGYSDIEGVFVDIPIEKSVERAQERHRHGLEEYRNGEGLGGRYVPPEVIRANADATWGSVNRRVFEELKPQFDRWKLYDNSVDGRDPVLLEASDNAEEREHK